MAMQRRLLQTLSIVVILSMLFSGFSLPSASAQSKDGIERQVNAQTGKLSFIGPDSGRALSAAKALGTSVRPQDPAMALAKRFGPEFGLMEPERNLKQMTSDHSEDGRIMVRYQQSYQGIPVMGGELIVNTNEKGDLYSINGEVSSTVEVSTQPTIEAGEAKQIALEAIAKWNQKTSADFVASEPALWIYDESLLHPSTRPAELVWRMDVTSVDNSLPVRELVLVNAQRGGISMHFNQIDTAWSPNEGIGAIQDPDPTATSLPIETPLPSETPLPTETLEPVITATPAPEQPESTKELPAPDEVRAEPAAVTAATWYVASTGNDSNSCATPAAPCATIQAAVDKANSGDRVYAAAGIYTTVDTGLFSYVVIINSNKGLSIYGGWDSGFVSQTGITVIDGENKTGGVRIYGGIPSPIVILDRLHIRNSPKSGVDFSSASVTITNSSIYNNSNIGLYKDGGGIHGNYSSLTISNTTISNNTTSGQGGGIYNYGGSLKANNVTITRNSATWGGGLMAGLAGEVGELRVSNSILFGNTASTLGPNCIWDFPTSDHTIIGDASDCTVSATNGNRLNINPKLGIFIEEAGYQPLLAGSPAINTGVNCFGTADQRGVPRVGNCDIGAYEYDTQGPASRVVIAGGNTQHTAPNHPFAMPLYVAVLDDNGSPLSGQSVNFSSPASGVSAVFTANGTHSIVVSTDSSGIAAAAVTANSLPGDYTVTASSAVGSVSFHLQNSAWYVSNTGSDTNSCSSPAETCSTINSAINKASAGDIILVAAGTYTGLDPVVQITKNVTIEGGWNADFSSQDGFSIIDGQNERRGIFVDEHITATIEKFIIQNGRASLGGGIYSGGLALTVNDTIVKDSVADYAGGAIYNDDGILTLHKSLIGNNRALQGGGGINSVGPVEISESAIFDNVADYAGGGINGNSTIHLSNVTIANNKANDGGGIYTGTAPVTINNTTISNNQAQQRGGGLFITSGSPGNVQMQNSILANNINRTSPDCAGSLESLGYNIIKSTVGCTVIVKTGDRFSVDPALGVFLPAPGVLPTLSGSPAIDHGNPATCLPTDQRGLSRVGTCDIGAYEYTPPLAAANIIIVRGDKQRTPPNFDFSFPLQIGITDVNGSPVGGVNVTFTAPAAGPGAVFQNNNRTITLTTGANGVATTTVKANDLLGSYSVTASASFGSKAFNLENIAWYVSPSGNDSNNCSSPATACLSMAGAVNKAAENDTVFVASGIYKGVGNIILSLNKDITLSGGWNDSFTVQNGYSTIHGEDIRTAVFVNSNVTATFTKFIVEYSHNAEIQRGAISNDGTLTLIDCEIRYNSTAYYAGGIMNRGILTIQDSLIHHNSGVWGGGIYNQGIMTVTDTVLTDNYAGEGGGIYNTDFNGPGSATLHKVFIDRNRAGGDGGGIYNQATIIISNTSIARNSAELRGGGMINHGTATLDNVSVAANTSVEGGGIQTGGSITLKNATISVNTSMIGGGLYVSPNYGSAQLLNTILAGNTVSKTGPDCSGTLVSSGYNILGNTGSCVMSATTGDRINLNPQLGTFLPSEGYVPLLPTSPAVNAGSPATCLATDQRGIARPQGSKCDIGAYEYTTPGPLIRLEIIGGSDQLTLFNTPFRKALQVVALDAIGSPVPGVSIKYQAPLTSPSGIFAGTGTNTVTVVSNSGGVAQPASFTADSTMGTYNVVASATGVSSRSFTLHNGPWLVVPESNGGNDNNDCMNLGTACASLNGVLRKATFQGGDPVWMAVGTYGNSTDQAILTISKPVNVYGGWDTTFTDQIGTSVLQDMIEIMHVIDVSLNNVTIQNTGFNGIRSFANLLVKDSTIRNNPATGIENNGVLTIVNSTITQNGDNELGWGYGGVYNSGSNPNANITIVNSTITNNKGDTFGGVGNDPSSSHPIKIRNTIIAGNTALYGRPYSPDCAGKFTSNGNNMIGNAGNINGNLCDVDWHTTDQAGYYLYDQLGNFIKDNSIDPMLGALQNLGNDLWVHPLKLGSPAIDTGSWNCSPVDQRGVARPQGKSCDIGAYEYEFNHDVSNLLITTYSAGNSANLVSTKVCDQTDLACTLGDVHAKAAHKYAIGIYNLYKNSHGRNSLDGEGIEILSSVHYGSNYRNAFWNGYMMVYGDGYGYPLADDIVAHEFTHGVTQYESNLFYYYQSGAINESFSDLWGEYYDQTNSLGNDTAGVKWQIGEDVSGQGAIRSMSNPPAYGDPDKMSSSLYYEGVEDSGGIHTNSGVNNKAIYLLVNGGTFNGKTVTSLGWEKTAAIYFEVNTKLLGSGSDYSDLYYALQQACSNLIGQKGITAGDCTEVKDAINAVEMNGQPAPNFNVDAPLCSGNTPVIAFADDMETGTASWTFTNGSNTRWQWDSPYGQYAQSGSHSLYADDDPAKATDASARLRSFVVPNGAYLHFAHAYDFESGSVYGDPTIYNFDGGVLEYSTNSGITWIDAGSLIESNGYKGMIYNGYGYNNPLRGRTGFVGSSHGYSSTRLNLASLAGKTVTFRWRMGLDESGLAWGWWVDNVKVYTCGAPAIFADVANTHWAWQYVERLYNARITGGCGTNPLQYCPESTVTRAQMAVFLLRGMRGSSYNPPAVGSSTGFEDVEPTHWAGAWIKRLAADGITSGCGSGNYCPESSVTRAQMAVFLLRSKYGASYSPPAVGGSTGFTDVDPSHWAGAWVKQLVAEGITSGCGPGTYCPESPVTRAQMAVFLVRTFNLP